MIKQLFAASNFHICSNHAKIGTDTKNCKVFVIAIGSVPNTDILKDLVKLDESGYPLVNHDLETPVPGLFLAGDVLKKDVKQLTTATSDGTICATRVIDYLNGL